MLKEKENKIPAENMRSHGIRVKDSILSRLTRYVSLVRSLKRKEVTREMFIEEAIQEKLSKESDRSLLELEPYRKISFRIPDELTSKLDKLLEFYRGLGRPVTKTEWVIEAIVEKLDQEEDEERKNRVPFDKDSLD